MKDIVIGLGEALFDCFPSGERKLGGAPANFVYHATQFGLSGYVISAVGQDELGDEALALLRKQGLQLCVSRVAQPTGMVKVTVDASGQPEYEIALGSAWDNIPLTAEAMALAGSCKALCLGSLCQRSDVSRRTVEAILGIVSSRKDCMVVFDVNLRQHYYSLEVLDSTLRKSTLLKINDEEILVMRDLMGKADLDEAAFCRFLIKEYGLMMLILTMGSKGSRVYTMEEMYEEPSIKVDVKSTVGAGDAFTGAFVAALLKGADIAKAQKVATRAAAWVCGFDGAMPVLPDEIISAL